MNKKPNILAISYYFPPLLTPRSIRLAILASYMAENELANWTVFSAEPVGYSVPIDHELTDLVSPRIKVHKSISMENRLITGLSKRIKALSILTSPDPSITWYPFAKHQVARIIQNEQYDVIISFSYPATSHIVARAIHKQFQIPWIAYFSDPLSSNILEIDGFSQLAKKKVEEWAFTEADGILFTNNYQREFSTSTYDEKIKRKSAVLPHAFDVNLIQKEPILDNQHKEKFRIVYAGSYYGKRDPELFILTIKKIREIKMSCYNELEIIFLGSKNPTLDKLIENHDLGKIIFTTKPFSYLKSLTFMNSADLLLVIDPDLEYSPFLPSKLIDYFCVSKPILAIAPKSSPTNDLLRRANQFVINKYTIEDITDGVINAWEMWKAGKLSSFSPPPQITEEYSIKKCASDLLKIISAFIKTK